MSENIIITRYKETIGLPTELTLDAHSDKVTIRLDKNAKKAGPYNTTITTPKRRVMVKTIEIENRDNNPGYTLINSEAIAKIIISGAGRHYVSIGDKTSSALEVADETIQADLKIFGVLTSITSANRLSQLTVTKNGRVNSPDAVIAGDTINISGHSVGASYDTSYGRVDGTVSVDDRIRTVNRWVFINTRKAGEYELTVGDTGVIERVGVHEPPTGQNITGTVYALAGGGDSKIVNNGKIKALTYEYTAPGHKTTVTAVMIGSGKLENNGEIVSDYNAVVVRNDSNRLTEIINRGKMTGAVSADGNESWEKSRITNTEGGIWELPMMRGHGDTYIDGAKKIENNGIIKVLKGGGKDTYLSGDLDNAGLLDLTDAPMKIVGNLTSKRGRLRLRTTLGGDNSPTTTLTIVGEIAGTTKLDVENDGGEGDATVNGILLITAERETNAEILTGRIVAGEYDYSLVKQEAPNGTEWRLISIITPVAARKLGMMKKRELVVRPETAAYGENMRQANTLFITGSDQRRAVGEYADPVTGRKGTSSLWLSQTGGHSTRHDACGQLKSDYNRYVVQLGGTMLSLPAGDDGRLETGVQAGYGHVRGDSRSGLTGYRARGTVSGYSTGIYGTWRQHREGLSGAYVSTTLQYSWLKNQVKGDDLAAEKYDARGTTLSLEGGYDLAVWQDGKPNGDSLFIRPRAQVTRMGVKADEHREANGTRVSPQGDGNVFSRTGVRMWLDKAVTKTQRVQPFVEANWLHNTRDFCSSMNGVRDCQAGNRDQAEVLAGVTGDVSRNVAVTAQAGGQFGSQASRDLAGTLNVSVKF
ncbi:hypothetical protein GFI10_22865 [Salmonella enterica subsp. diarizonae]|nr:hypothetical protein [Salmonella enterica subsp. diarizonae]HEA0304645.1 autotransporter outer membrane beta-barrel domain-containing protein [Salmonella enterica]HEA0346936.1 autotransporter outer membrane beta-barrel domain-containing protein [Salmonella enterica]